jgi:signal transduction histidine kinase
VTERSEAKAQRAGTTVRLLGEPQLVVQGDGSRLDRVMTNLVNNAIKYGNGTPVTVEVVRGAEGAEIRVTDHGIGIAAADQGRIFEKFERAVSADNFGGFGLGLFIVREIVLAHGGTIGVTSEPGAGATFRVRLPM